MQRRTILLCTFCASLYVLAFVVVHQSYTFLRPAANMNYWYYSDDDAVEALEFYGFWPLRQAAYHAFPGYARHNSERDGRGPGWVR